MIFDGICNLCCSSIRFLIERDKADRLTYLPFQTEEAKNLLKSLDITVNPSESVILISDGKVYYKSDAFFKIVRNLQSTLKYFYPFKILPKKLLDFIYDYIANNRNKWFGKRQVCYIPIQKMPEKK